MAADSLDIFVLECSDPAQQDIPQERSRVNPAVSFEFPSNNIQTLSTNTVDQGSQIEGLLFVPELPPNHPCINASAQYIPRNATRLRDLPSVQYQYVAFAPWISATCTSAYLSAVPGRLVSAFLFYVANSNSTDTPPPPSDATWALQDGGAWKRRNKFPVYAMPGPGGRVVMQQLAEYSGKISEVKNGDLLAEGANPSDYVRLYANFELDLGNSLPTLWAFLLIVLAVVLILVGITSVAMHWTQRRNRRNLQERVERGEVDIEMLGMKRQQMTQAEVDALPVVAYNPAEAKPAITLPDPVATQPPDPSTAVVNLPSSSSSQDTCPICLDEYEPHKTSVRVLQCNHIYHPGCIDQYLLSTSTLCPLCKANCRRNSDGNIPCPAVTNAMVRHERHARRVRERQTGTRSDGAGVEGLGRWATFRSNYRTPIRGVPLVRSLPLHHRRTRSQGLTENVGSSATAAAVAGRTHGSGSASGGADGHGTDPPDANRQSEVMRELELMRTGDSTLRREAMRRRASHMLAHDTAVAPGVVNLEAEERGRSRLHRGIARVFPGFR